VCSSWCWQLTVGPSAWQLWTELDLSETAGVTCTRGDAALERAAALARGKMEELIVRGENPWAPAEEGMGETFVGCIMPDAVLRVAIANRAHLKRIVYLLDDTDDVELNKSCDDWTWVNYVVLNVEGLDSLTVNFEMTPTVSPAQMYSLLRREPPFTSVHINKLCFGARRSVEFLENTNNAVSFFEHMKDHNSITEVHAYRTTLADAALAPFVDTVLSVGIEYLHLCGCIFGGTGVSQLARLLCDSKCNLKGLCIVDSPTLFLNIARREDVELLYDALLNNRTLKTLTLDRVGLNEDAVRFVRPALRKLLASGSDGVVVELN
jgi:hypothetical protein